MTKRWQGRNVTDRLQEDMMIPDGVQPWDYWKLGDKLPEQPPGNLTGHIYGVCVPKLKNRPLPSESSAHPSGFRCVTLSRHTIREHDDGTISIMPRDGSSNSIAIPDTDFHGWIDHGVWFEQ